MTEKKKKNEVLYLSFNRDKSCLAIGMKTGYRIYDLTKKNSLFFYERIFGKSIGQIEMLEKTGILGLVGYNEEEESFDSPKKLNIYDDKESVIVAYITFKNNVLHFRIKRDKIIVVLEDFIFLIDTINYKSFDKIELGEEKKEDVVFSFTLENDVNKLAYNFTNRLSNKIIINTYIKEEKLNSVELKTDYKINNNILYMEFDKDGKILAVTARKYEYLVLYRVEDGIPICNCNINSKSINTLYISFDLNNEFICACLDVGEVIIFNIREVNNKLNEHNQNEKIKKEEIWSKFYLPEKKAACIFAGDEIGKNHIISIGAKGNYYLVKYKSNKKEDLAEKIDEKYILKIEN